LAEGEQATYHFGHESTWFCISARIFMAKTKKQTAASASLARDRAAVLKGRYAVPALDKAFDVVELLASTPGGATLNEIATRLGRSMGELFRIVIALERRGLLQK